MNVLRTTKHVPSKKIELVSFEGGFHHLFGPLLLGTLGRLEEWDRARIGFRWISVIEMEMVLQLGCRKWDATRSVSSTLIPKGQTWTSGEMDQRRYVASQVGVRLEFV